MLNEYGVARFRALLGRLRPQIVFGTEAEADLLGGLDGTDLAGTDLVVKLGARGVRAGAASTRRTRWTRWTRPGQATRSPRDTWSAGSAWAWPRRPGR